MWSSLPCFFTLCCSALPTSCHIFNIYYYLFTSRFSSRLMHKLKFSITEQQNSVLTGCRLLTLAVLAEESLTHCLSQSFSGSPCLKTRCTHRSMQWQAFQDNTSIIHLFIHSYNYIHIYDRDLPQSIQDWLTTQCIPGSSITCAGIPTPFLIQWSWVIISCCC